MACSSAFTRRFPISVSQNDMKKVDYLINKGTFSSNSHAFREFMKLWFRVFQPETEIEGD